jgi:hypothetical protein
MIPAAAPAFFDPPQFPPDLVTLFLVDPRQVGVETDL